MAGDVHFDARVDGRFDVRFDVRFDPSHEEGSRLIENTIFVKSNRWRRLGAVVRRGRGVTSRIERRGGDALLSGNNETARRSDDVANWP